MSSEESGVNKQEASRIVSQVPVAPSLSPPPANANEMAGLSQSHSLIDSRNLLITGGQFSNTLGHHLVININQGSLADSRSNSPSNEIHNINLAQFSDQSSQVDPERNQSQVPSQSPEIPFQKSNDIYERHLTLKGRGFPLWIPDPNEVLHLDYRRTGVRIGDVGIITRFGAFSFLFNICLPHNDPVNGQMLPEDFAPISPPIKAANIEKFRVFKNSSHLASASVKKRSQTGTAISDIVFESSASEGAILTMPQGARSEDLGNLARFREYAAANVANWYRFVNGPLGREAQNGDVRLVVGFDKTTSWGIATFANQTQENSCLLKFGPSEGDSASTYTWSEYSGVADVRAGPDSDEIDELRIDNDPPGVQFQNQCLFVRTLNTTLADDIWADIHSSSDSIPVDPRKSQYPRAKDYSDSNGPQSQANNPDNASDFSPPQGAQSGTQRRLQDVEFMSDEKPSIFVSGPDESIASTTHPSKVLNDTLLSNIPTAKMVITHDEDWSSVTKNDTLLDPHELVANILASRDIYQENGVVFLEPKKMVKEISEGSTFVNRAQVPEAAVVRGSPAHYVSPLIHDKSDRELFHADRGEEYANEKTSQDDEQSTQTIGQWLKQKLSWVLLFTGLPDSYNPTNAYLAKYYEMERQALEMKAKAEAEAADAKRRVKWSAKREAEAREREEDALQREKEAREREANILKREEEVKLSAEQARLNLERARLRGEESEKRQKEAKEKEEGGLADKSKQATLDAKKRELEANARVLETRKREAETRKAADEAQKREEQLQKDLQQAKFYLEKGMQPEVWPTKEEFQLAKNRIQYDPEKLHFAVCGSSGCGKSSLINAFRGLKNNAPQAAPTDVVETTKDITRYPESRKELPYNRLVWFECPGAGTLDNPGWHYFNRQGLFIFDIIVLVYDSRFTEIDVTIIRNCERYKIPLFIVRSRADMHIRNIMQDIGYDENDDADDDFDDYQKRARQLLIDTTRKNLVDNLLKAELNMHDVFIVTGSVIFSLVNTKALKKTTPQIDEARLMESILKKAHARRYGTQAC